MIKLSLSTKFTLKVIIFKVGIKQDVDDGKFNQKDGSKENI
jgi:hypothetical protein